MYMYKNLYRLEIGICKYENKFLRMKSLFIIYQ